MATTTGKATYQGLIDDVRFDLNQGARLASLPDRAIQKWILEAEEKISSLIDIQESYDLGLDTLVEEYPFQDRPVITGASNATPIVITAVDHGIVSDDRLYASNVLGNAAANGDFLATRLTADTFSLRQVVDITDASNASPISIEAKKHGFSTGDSITDSLVTGNTAANGTFTITVTDVDHFTLDGSTGNGAYQAGGIATKTSVGSGTYTAGGRFWRDREIPTYFGKFHKINRGWASQMREVKVVSIANLLAQESRDTSVYRAYSSYDSPCFCAEVSMNGVRALRFYPAPEEDATVRLYGTLRIEPRLYLSDPLSSNVHLSYQFEGMILSYAKAKVLDWLELYERSVALRREFNDLVETHKMRMPSYAVKEMRYF